jgi:hypothetical protein
VRVTSFVERELGCSPLLLVVADDEETRDGIEKLLVSDGYRAATVVGTAVRIRRRAEIDASVPVVVFCVPTIDQGAEIALGRNVYVTRPDNFDQLRDFLGRLILSSLGLP